MRTTNQKLLHASTERADVSFEYLSTSDRFDNAVNRISRVKLSTTAVADYDYLGLGRVVGTTYPEVEIFSKQYSATAGAYPDLDQFNRVVVSKWTKDLTTDRDVYKVGLTYDHDSNITVLEDEVYPGRDVSYTMDDLNRLKVADEGTWSGSAITSRTRKEEWTLDRAGNWGVHKNDLDGDGAYSSANEKHFSSTYNKANEYDEITDVIATITFPIGTAPAGYNPRGDYMDEKRLYRYKYDAFGRLRFVFAYDQFNELYYVIAEHRYNGLGHRIGWHYDVDVDGTVEGSSDDPWLYFAYDPQWRMVGQFRAADTNARELFVNHPTGWGLDGVILRDRDANTALSSAMDGTREERLYHCQNWRGDVVKLISATGGGRQVEGARYSSYGVPLGLPFGDTDGDGDSDATDENFVSTRSGDPGQYDIRGDFDLDGDIDFTDESLFFSSGYGPTLGFGNLSNLESRKGYAGYEHDGKLDTLAHVRNRVLATEEGRWTRRDPLNYVDGASLYGYVGGNPVNGTDTSGLRRIMAHGGHDEFANPIDFDDEPSGGPCLVYPCLAAPCPTNPPQSCTNVTTAKCWEVTASEHDITCSGPGCGPSLKGNMASACATTHNNPPTNNDSCSSFTPPCRCVGSGPPTPALDTNFTVDILKDSGGDGACFTAGGLQCCCKANPGKVGKYKRKGQTLTTIGICR